MSYSAMSNQGMEALIAEEGEVLKTYIDAVGVRTIGVGLTKASGVINPKPGMTITKAQSRALLHKALERNYIPRVKRVGLDTRQNELDGSTMFDFNTGRIHNASWVGHYKRKDYDRAESSFKSWNKGGGKTLRGLTRRRATEWDIIRHNRYPKGGAKSPSGAVSVSDLAVRAYQQDLKTLGYYKGNVDGLAGPQTLDAVRQFQRDHKLTVDGIVGPATRATIKRALDARKQKQQTGAGGAGGTVVGGGGDAATSDVGIETVMWALGLGLTVAALIFIGWMIWRNRGPLFAWLPEGAKDWFEDRGILLGRRAVS